MERSNTALPLLDSTLGSLLTTMIAKTSSTVAQNMTTPISSQISTTDRVKSQAQRQAMGEPEGISTWTTAMKTQILMKLMGKSMTMSTITKKRRTHRGCMNETDIRRLEEIPSLITSTSIGKSIPESIIPMEMIRENPVAMMMQEDISIHAKITKANNTPAVNCTQIKATELLSNRGSNFKKIRGSRTKEGKISNPSINTRQIADIRASTTTRMRVRAGRKLMTAVISRMRIIRFKSDLVLTSGLQSSKSTIIFRTRSTTRTRK